MSLMQFQVLVGCGQITGNYRKAECDEAEWKVYVSDKNIKVRNEVKNVI